MTRKVVVFKTIQLAQQQREYLPLPIE